MTTRQTSETAGAGTAGAAVKAAHRAMWGLGDYHRFARSTVWELGPVLVDACGVSAGTRLLDVAAGTGNVAIRAAKAGAAVVASDLTPANFDAGREAARAEGVTLEWIEADAEALPFDDDAFDVVTSSFGAIFAPNQRAVADELVRVCRPGGTIGMLNFVPDGAAAAFFGLFARYAPPPPPGATPPLLWGDPDHVRALFGDRVESLEMTRRTYVERATSPHAYRELFKETFGPLIAVYQGLADQPERLSALDRDFLEFVTRENQDEPAGPVRMPYDYLLVVARKRRV